MRAQSKPTTQILLIDDNAEFRLSMAMTLELENFTVHTAEDGLEALAMLEDVTPDLILSDIQMPMMGGYALYRELRKNPRWSHIPVIFITAERPPEALPPDQAARHEDVLLKPIDPGRLVRTIQAHLDRPDSGGAAMDLRKYH